MGEGIEESFYIRIENPTDFLLRKRHIDCIERIVLASLWVEPVKSLLRKRFPLSIAALFGQPCLPLQPFLPVVVYRQAWESRFGFEGWGLYCSV